MEARTFIARLAFGAVTVAVAGAAERRRHDEPAPPPAAAAAVGAADAPTGADSTGQGSGTARDSTTPRGLRTGTGLVRDYDRAGAPPDTSDSAAGGGGKTVAPSPSVARAAVAHALVVVLPDPTDSHLDWAFDSEIESVRRAFEVAGYVLDQYALPWRLPGAATSTAAAAAADADRRRVPGVMLFRQAGAPDSLSVVYLVGEVPTSGVHVDALAAALRDRHSLLCDSTYGSRAEQCSDTLRVVGPTFSGSIPSLRNALLAAQARRQIGAVSVVSGGATAPDNPALIKSPGSNGIVFHATVNPVNRLRCRAEDALKRGLSIRQSEIAYLTESGTKFGRSLSPPPQRAADSVPQRSDTTRTQAQPQRAGPPSPPSTPGDTPSADSACPDSAPGSAADATSTSADSASADSALRDSSLKIPFPMNISRLRREFARNVLPGDTAGQTQTSLTRIDWRDPASSSESPAPLSELTAPMIERTLSDIEQTLLLHHIRAVGILATDVRDRLFLASIVKDRLRDVKVFFFSSHSLYLRPELNRKLRGALVVSTYPLFLENQFWDLTHQPRDRLVFTSDMSEGTYNATLAQLNRHEAMVEYGPPLDPATREHVPPVWITTIGARSLLPLVVDTVGSRTDSAGYVWVRGAIAPRHTVESEPEHYVVQSVLLAVVLFTLLVFAQVWGLRAPDGRGPPDAAVERVRPWGDHAAALRFHRESWVALRFSAIMCAFAPVTLVMLRPQVHGRALSRVWFVLVGVGMALAAVVALGAVVRVVVVVWYRSLPPVPSRDPAAPGQPDATRARPWYRRWYDRVLVRHDAWRRVWTGARKEVRDRRGRLGPGVWARVWGQHAAIHLISAGYVAMTAAFIVEVGRLSRPAANLFFLRALALDSGVTPVLPLLVGAVLVTAWCTWHLTRVRMLQDLSAFEAACDAGKIDTTGLAGAGALGNADRFRRAVRDARWGLFGMTPGPESTSVLIGLLVFGAWVLLDFDRSIDTILLHPLAERPGWVSVPGTFDLLFRFLVLAAVSLNTWTLYRLLVVWRALRACLHGVESMPIGAAFLRLPSTIAGLTRFTPFNAPSAASVDLTIDRAAAERWTELLAIDPRPDYALDLPLGPAPPSGLAYAIRAAHGTLDPDVATPLIRLHRSLCAGAAGGAVPLAPEAREEKRGATPDAKQEENPGPATPRRDWSVVAQELVALYVVDYVEWVVRHLRHLALSLVVALALTTVLLSSYPFEPASLVKVFFFAVMAASVASIASLLFQMNRNVTMSRITHTTPGQVNWDTQLVSNLVLVSAVPILTLLTAQFPQIRGFLFSWVTPALTSISKG